MREDNLVCIFQVSAAVFLSGVRVCVYVCVCERDRRGMAHVLGKVYV